MDQPTASAATELSAVETAAVLRDILATVKKDERQSWVEISTAIVLSLATMASAWCAYQSNLWGGVQTFRLAAAAKAGRESAENTIAAYQTRAFDATMFIRYIEAKGRDEKQLEEFLYDRFRPEMRKALDAWLATAPLTTPTAPPHPFKMAEYAQVEMLEAKQQDDLSDRMLSEARQANETSDTYVMLTVLFASVLFAGGIASTFRSRQLRRSMGCLALALFLATTTYLATMPVCHE